MPSALFSSIGTIETALLSANESRMKLNKTQLINALGLDRDDQKRLYGELDNGTYNNPFVAFACKDANEESLEVCKDTIEWIKSSRRNCENGIEPMNHANFKVNRTIEKLKGSDESYTMFVFGFIDNFTYEFESAFVVGRDDCNELLVANIISVAREKAIAIYGNKKLSEAQLRKSFMRLFNASERYKGIVDDVLAHIEQHDDVIVKATSQLDVRNSEMKFFDFIYPYFQKVDGSSEFSKDTEKEQLLLLNELFKLGIVTMMFGYNGKEYGDIYELCNHLYPGNDTIGYQEIIDSHGNEIKVIFEFNIEFIKGFRLE